MATYMLPHLGLGDAYVLAGMVRHLAKLWDHPIIFPCKLHNLATVRELFEDLDQVCVLPVRDDSEMVIRSDGWNKFPLGFHASTGRFDARTWVTSFYEEVGLSPQLSWDSFKLAKRTVARLNVDILTIDPAFHHGRTAFIHQDCARGFRIDAGATSKNSWWINPVNKPGNSAFDWLPALYYADEVHCIDSSFLHLADRVFWAERKNSTKPRKLFLHADARQSPIPALKCNWEILT